ncbi:helix-turn-helix domain-containing protein [Mesorhizobium sp. C089B]|uniref:helix-turn-helix domain-containing protein n=1 Tax=Mesorhizobium sp. C089B TaxID=2956823 RepID=UPI00336BDE13
MRHRPCRASAAAVRDRRLPSAATRAVAEGGTDGSGNSKRVLYRFVGHHVRRPFASELRRSAKVATSPKGRSVEPQRPAGARIPGGKFFQQNRGGRVGRTLWPFAEPFHPGIHQDLWRAAAQYLLRLRLDFAEKLLIESDLSIAEVAHLSGFSDQSHLTVTMSRYRNRTPRQVKLQR